MNYLILFTILISFETPDWQSEDGIYFKELNEVFTLVQYIEGTGYVFSVDIADLGFADALDVINELQFKDCLCQTYPDPHYLGIPDFKKGGFEKGFLYLEWGHQHRIIFFFNNVRFRLEIIK